MFEPTYVNVSLGSVYINKRSWLEYARDLGSIFISELPPMPGLVGLPSYCTNRSTGAMFDPLKKLDVPLRGKFFFKFWILVIEILSIRFRYAR